MHGLNVVGIPGLPPPLLPTNLSHTWSLIAIAGFCLTSLSQVKKALTSRFRRSKKGIIIPLARNDDVTLP